MITVYIIDDIKAPGWKTSLHKFKILPVPLQMQYLCIITVYEVIRYRIDFILHWMSVNSIARYVAFDYVAEKLRTKHRTYINHLPLMRNQCILYQILLAIVGLWVPSLEWITSPKKPNGNQNPLSMLINSDHWKNESKGSKGQNKRTWCPSLTRSLERNTPMNLVPPIIKIFFSFDDLTCSVPFDCHTFLLFYRKNSNNFK